VSLHDIRIPEVKKCEMACPKNYEQMTHQLIESCRLIGEQPNCGRVSVDLDFQLIEDVMPSLYLSGVAPIALKDS